MEFRNNRIGAVRRLSLVKGWDRYVFEYEAGREEQVINELAKLAEDESSPFDWFDASVLSYQIGRRFEQERGINQNP